MWGTTSLVVDGIILYKCRFFSVNTFTEAVLLTSLKDQISIGVIYLREGNGNPLQSSCLENPMDREAWWAAVHGVAQSRNDWSDLAAAAAGHYWGYPHGSDGKKSACNAGNLGSIPGSGGEMANHSSILAWKIPWTEEPGGP